MERKKPGTKPKDSVITDNPNMQKAGEKPLSAREIAKLEQQKFRLEQKLGDAGKPKKPKKKATDPAAEEERELRLAQKMVEDLRYAYRNAAGKDGKKGRDRLVKLMETDFEFKFAMKELMRIEGLLVSSKIKARENGGGGGNTATLVILKGLYDEEKINAEFDDPDVDLKQIANALNPESTLETETMEEQVEGPKP